MKQKAVILRKPRVSKDCLICGTEMSLSPSMKSKKCCSFKCAVKARIGRKNPFTEEHKKKISTALKGKNNHFWKDGRSYEREYFKYMSIRSKIRSRTGNIKNIMSYEEWKKMLIKYEYKCPCCKKQEPEITLGMDHITPISKGGGNNINNIQPLCNSCNIKKHTRIIKYEYA